MTDGRIDQRSTPHLDEYFHSYVIARECVTENLRIRCYYKLVIEVLSRRYFYTARGLNWFAFMSILFEFVVLIDIVFFLILRLGVQ